MKITIELPDDTLCAFISFVNGGISGMEMGVKQLCTADLEKAKEAKND